MEGSGSREEPDLAILNELARTMIEAVAKSMGADRGSWRLEFELVDGQLRRAFKHAGPIAGTALVGAT